ncbi:hypothetical protein ACFWY5_03810 [Nonomuraea sp. NPDC059007]|uniref:hypothetical protein n=1 Tax=Nonomuraea sp. NPDC059007 TaxID=3346692 RepID=UPI0036ADC113
MDVRADWSLRVERSELRLGYAMEELGSRVDIDPASDEVPFARHVGERLVRVVERVDSDDTTERVGAEFVFDLGSVRAETFGGDLRLTDCGIR